MAASVRNVARDKLDAGEFGGILYCNDGDWFESCTALVEHFDGHLEIINWAERRRLWQTDWDRAAGSLVGADA
jgi:hypothetical protein